MNDNYFYISESDRKQIGPISITELVSKIKPSTMIWCPGMPDWAPASMVTEVAEMLGAQSSAPSADPAPWEHTACLYGSPQAEFREQPTASNPEQQNPQKPEPEAVCDYPNHKVWAIWVLVFSLLTIPLHLMNAMPMILAIVALVRSGNVDTLYNLGDKDGSRKTSDMVRNILLLATVVLVVINAVVAVVSSMKMPQ